MARDICNAEISLDQLSGIRPFIVVADEQLTITWASEPVLRRAANALGLKVFDIVEPIEPREKISPSSIARNMGMQYEILLKNGGCSTPLIGHWVPSHGGFILMANPDVRKPEDLDKFSFDDFHENDHTIELLTTREEHITSLKEAKSAAKALRQERDFAESVIKTAQAIILVLDVKGRIVRFNPYLEEISGYSLDEVQGKDWFSTFLPGRDHTRIRALFKKAVSDIQTRSNVNPIVTKDGSERQIEWSDKTIKDVDGNVEGLLAVGLDITERKALQEETRRLAAIAEQAAEGIAVADLEGNIQFANHTWAEMHGYGSGEKLVGRPLSIFHTEEQIKTDVIPFNKEVKKRGHNIGEVGHMRKDGTTFPAMMTTSLLKDEQDRPYAIAGTIQDITERKKAEEEQERTLQRQQAISQLLQSLLASAPLENKLRTITDSIIRILDADFCRLWLIRPGDLCERDCIHAQVVEGPHMCRHRDGCLHLLASSGRYTHIDGKTHRRIPFGCNKIGRIASGEDHKIITNDVQNDPRIHDHEWARELGLVSFAGYQLRIPGEKTIGVLALFAKHHILSPEDAMLDGLSSATAQVIKQAVAEEGLKESEQKFRTIFDNASDGMFLVDLETRKLLMCNARCSQLLGYAQEEFQNLEIPDLHPPDDLPFVFEEIAKFMKGEKGVGRDLRFRRKDGSEFLCDFRPSLITLAGRKAVLLIYQDISERKKAEEETKLNEHRVLDLLELYKIASSKEKAILDFTLEASQRSLQSEFGFLGFVSADEAEVTIQAWTKGVMEQCAVSETPLHFPVVQAGLWGEIVRQRRPIIVNSYDTSTEFKKGYPTGHVSIKRFLGIPVFSGSKIACVAAVANKVSEYTTSDVSSFTALINEMWHIVERIKIQNEKRQANEELVVLVKKLENRNHQNTILSEMREMLQACSTIEEAAPIVRGLMERLYPDSEGALFMMNPSRSDLESVARWGDFPEDVDENVFAPDDCWALRLGRTHFVENVSVGPLCPHLKHPPSTAYMCLPLIAKGDVLGLLHLRSRQSAQVQSEQNVISDLKDMAVVLSEYLSLSIANIQLQERLASQSVRDPLTGLFNRRFMMEALEREIKRAERKKTQVGIIMADIDHFKQFNDQHGHAAGDKVLAQLGGFFKTALRGSDVACRYGGEEFAFFLSEASAENTFKRADQMREEVKKLEVHLGSELLASITLSMGISTYPDQGSKAEDLLRVADAALYRAKQEGRDRVIVG